MSIEISPLTLPHLYVAEALHKACFEKPWNHAELADLFAMPGCFGCLDGADKPRGFALCQSTGEEAEILTICTLPEARGLGLGRAMMDWVVSTLRQNNVQTLFLEVAEDNGPARGLYNAFGFQQVGRRAGYYSRAGQNSLDALVLCLKLD